MVSTVTPPANQPTEFSVAVALTIIIIIIIAEQSLRGFNYPRELNALHNILGCINISHSPVHLQSIETKRKCYNSPNTRNCNNEPPRMVWRIIAIR